MSPAALTPVREHAGLVCVWCGMTSQDQEPGRQKARDSSWRVSSQYSSRASSAEGQAPANGRVALGSFAVCCGWVIASTRFLPRWVGGGHRKRSGLALSRISWTSHIWLLPDPEVLTVGTRW